jgi:hypothetical protein
MTISIPEQLAFEFRQLGIGDNAQPVATFSAKPMEAYTLLAALQACSRHPGLSDTQRDLVLGFAHQIGDQLVAMARAIIGPDSAIETTSAMGFDPQYDVDDRRCRLCGCTTERACEGGCSWVAPDLCSSCAGMSIGDLGEDLDELSSYEDEVEDSHVLGERRINYVEPKWIALSTDPEDAELSKCARCSRFFVQDMPIRLFQDLGEQIVLGFEVCEACAPSVVSRMR